MAKTTTPLTAQERVILFCTATGVSHAAVGITRTQCSPWPLRDSSSTIARACSAIRRFLPPPSDKDRQVAFRRPVAA
jgi:hypothetical protein